eukprot:s803_g14.t1
MVGASLRSRAHTRANEPRKRTVGKVDRVEGVVLLSGFLILALATIVVSTVLAKEGSLQTILSSPGLSLMDVPTLPRDASLVSFNTSQ